MINNYLEKLIPDIDIHSIEDFNFINDDFKVVSLKDQPYQILVDDKSFYEEYYIIKDYISNFTYYHFLLDKGTFILDNNASKYVFVEVHFSLKNDGKKLTIFGSIDSPNKFIYAFTKPNSFEFLYFKKVELIESEYYNENRRDLPI